MTSPILVPGEAFFAIQVFDQSGYFGCVTDFTLLGVKAKALCRSSVAKGIILCTLPFEGAWSATGIPDVTMPADFKTALSAINKTEKDE